jgi:hypothetical protein
VMQMPEQPRRVPFQYGLELDKFEKAFAESLRSYLNTKRAELMPAENVQAYRHGTAWKSGASEEVSEMQSHEHGMTVKFDDVITHNVSAMRRTFLQLGDAMHTSIMQMMYFTVSKAANAVGNTVSVKAAGSPAKAFLDMLQKIEFGVDRHGKPSLPQIHASPELVDAFLKDLQKEGPEFEIEVERIKQEKIAAALEREQERRSRFKIKS